MGIPTCLLRPKTAHSSVPIGQSPQLKVFRMSGLYDHDFTQKGRNDTPIPGRLQLPPLERHPRKRNNRKSPSLPKGVVLQSGRYRVTLTKYVPRQRPEQYCLGTYDTVEEASDVYARGDAAWRNGTIDEFRASCRSRPLPVGVIRIGTRYAAQMQATPWGRVHNLGMYDTAKQASDVYQRAKVASTNGTLERYKAQCIELTDRPQLERPPNQKSGLPFGLLPKTRRRPRKKKPVIIKTEPLYDAFPIIKKESADSDHMEIQAPTLEPKHKDRDITVKTEPPDLY